MDHPDKRQRAERRDKQGRLARTVDAPAAPDQVRRQPAARNRADVGEQVDGDQRRTDRREETGVARRRSAESRVGKACGRTCRARWSPYPLNNKDDNTKYRSCHSDRENTTPEYRTSKIK